ncbi:MAG: tetratricopeptide repeat protein [Gemmataceae bacterium]
MALSPHSRTAGRVALGGLLIVLVGLGLWQVSRYFLAEYHIKQAARALERQRYRFALEGYQKAAGYRQGSAALHLQLARAARRVGNLPMARDHLLRCRELQNGVSEEQQVEAYLVRAQSGEVDEVYRFLVPYLTEEGPFTTLVLEALVRAYMARYQADLAARHIHRWLELEPDNVEAIFRRGTLYAQQQNTKGAAADYQRVLELDESRTEVRAPYAEILRVEKKFEEAAEQYRLVLERLPQDVTALVGLALCYVEVGKADRAREQMLAVPEEDESADASYARGLVEMRSNRPERAEPYLRRALVRDRGHFDACYNLMLCLTRLGRGEEAGTVKARLEQIEADQKRLIAISTREMDASPSNPDLHCELGEIYQRLGHPERGARWFRTALRHDPDCRRAHEGLRDYYDGLGPEGKERVDYHRRLAAH